MNLIISKLRKDFGNNNLDAVLISSTSSITYLTGYSGFSKEERETYLLITKNQQYILTDRRYSGAVKTLFPDFKLLEVSSENPLENILQKLKSKHKINKLGVEENDLKVREYKNIKKYFNNIYHYSDIDDLRRIKAEDEISKIEAACKLGDKTFDYVLKKIHAGISEKELALEIELFIRKQSGDISFSPIVAFGKNSAIPHHKPTDNKLKNIQIVLMDFGVKLNNYCSDMTRTIFFGYATEEFQKIYKTVLESQQKAINILNTKYLIHNTIPAQEVDKATRDYIVSRGYETLPHSVGHGVGIDVHETPHLSPKSKDILKEGMVFSIEPGIYISNFGGVRIEDLVVLGKNKLRMLTRSPKNLIEL